jgi:uncharacterized protein (DUF433 family)
MGLFADGCPSLLFCISHCWIVYLYKEEIIMNYNDRIEIHPLVCSGKPVVKGTRILVNVLLNELAAGVTSVELLRGYPGLTIEDIHAALEYAAAVITHSDVEELK